MPQPILYLPSGWTEKHPEAAEVAIEDFEVQRLVDGHGHTLQDAAAKVGVSKSTAGRMLQRSRRLIAISIERRLPFFLDASEDLELQVQPTATVDHSDTGGFPVLAVAVTKAERDVEVARIFGRAAFFAIFRNWDSEPEFMENRASLAPRNAARDTIRMLSEQGVGCVVAGRFGSEAIELLGEVKIEAVVASGIRLDQALDLAKFATR
ncbi:DUF134 domain-containing protein [Pelagicoccus albus]|uniref:DUF134 domain-containing protein n=1 Tax=Pelagicoccus albus TaxID=415222 RepID=A0A7X1E8E1_9BACT|nr:DUF134 domain-containing protein [Pelagicoccus albus]